MSAAEQEWLPEEYAAHLPAAQRPALHVVPTEQGDLFELVPAEPAVTPPRVTGATHRERFESFHALNPWVADTFERMGLDEIAHGATGFGVKALAEVLRWAHRRKTVGEPVKLNNNHFAFYARLLIERHPEWADVIETREQRTP